jgi:putative ABC transport system permease protein
MRAVVYLAVHQLHTRWRGWAVLVLLVAIAGGAVLAAAAGALRTATAYPRFLTASEASDVIVGPSGSGPSGYFSGLRRYYDVLSQLPGVRALAPVAGLNLEPLGHSALAARGTAMAPVDGRFGQLVEVPKMLAGRMPAAGRPGEIAVDQRAAAMMGLRVGGVLAMRAVPNGPPPGAGAVGQGHARPPCCGSEWSASWSPADRSFPLPSSTRSRSSWSVRRCSTG